MINRFRITMVIYFVLLLALVGSVVELVQNVQQNGAMVKKESLSDFVQPPLQPGVFPWSIRSIDTQVVSKHWPNVSLAAIQEQVQMIKKLGVNYVAIGTPYDKVDEYRMWANEIHKAGLHVWFRSHWDEWEGDDGLPGSLTPDDYLYRTQIFIENNPDIFQAGDAFTACVEAEQVGVGLGKRFLTWDQYRNFLLSEVVTSNKAFEKIGLKGKIYTNWLSVNGWIVDNEFTQDLVSKLGLIVVDHYVGQSQTIGDYSDANQVVPLTMTDFDRFHKEWNVPILVGEWGYQIFQKVSDDLQAEVVRDMFTQLQTKNYIVGLNYWVHMGNSSSLIGDQYGSHLTYRKAAYVVQSFFDPSGTLPTVTPTPTPKPTPRPTPTKKPSPPKK